MVSIFWSSYLLTTLNPFMTFNHDIWFNIGYFCERFISDGDLVPSYYSVLFKDYFSLEFPFTVLNVVSVMVLSPLVTFISSEKYY